MIGQFKQQPLLMRSPSASEFSQFPKQEPVVVQPVVDEPPVKKTRGRTKNKEYIGLSETDKRKAIRQKTYATKGKLYHARRSRIKNFDMEKTAFDGCETITEMNQRVEDHLKSNGHSDKIVYQLMTFCRRYDKQ